jgi:DNA-binding response OmpR family regulator
LGHPFVLIAEDDIAIRKLLCTVLKKQGIAAEVAEDGIRALERAGSGHFDALLLDLMMPHLSGWKVLDQLRARGSHLAEKVVVITAAGDADVRRLPAGTRVLHKPFDIDQLLAMVRDLLGMPPATIAAIEPAPLSPAGERIEIQVPAPLPPLDAPPLPAGESRAELGEALGEGEPTDC